jgi:hypothetical protein
VEPMREEARLVFVGAFFLWLWDKAKREFYD